jgi:hypothetical protein
LPREHHCVVENGLPSRFALPHDRRFYTNVRTKINAPCPRADPAHRAERAVNRPARPSRLDELSTSLSRVSPHHRDALQENARPPFQGWCLYDIAPDTGE